MDAKEDVLDLVKGVGDLVKGAVVGATDLVKGAEDALDAEDIVLVHVHRKERVRLVPHAIVVLAVLVRVLHVHLVEDVLDQVDAEDALDAMLGATDLVKLLASVIAVGATDLVNRNAQLDARDAPDAQEDAPDAQEDVVLDVTAHVLEIATDVVMAVVVDAKTHALLPAQQRVQVPAKLKHLVP